MEQLFPSAEFFAKNRQNILNDLPENSLIIAVSNANCIRNGDVSYFFRQDSDFFYLTGLTYSKQILILNKNAVEYIPREVLYAPEPNPKEEIWTGKLLDKQEITNISAIENVFFYSDEDEIFRILKKIVKNRKIENVYIQKIQKGIFERSCKADLATWLSQYINKNKIKNLTTLTAPYRLKKHPEELRLIKRSIQITKQAFYRILKNVKPRMFEYEIQAEIAYVFLSNGVFHNAFNPIIASGPNNNTLHYEVNNRQMQKGELLLIDFGAEYLHYAADITRTIPVSGHFTKRQKQVYNAVLEAQKYAKNIIKPGITIKEINSKTGEFIQGKLYELGLIDPNSEKNSQKSKTPLYFKYFMHGTSHFLGLDVHDVGNKEISLEPGHVITCEPGIYIKEEGFGIRLENDILITQTGIEDLSSEIPIEADQIEELMTR